jgi:hypothetical protein
LLYIATALGLSAMAWLMKSTPPGLIGGQAHQVQGFGVARLAAQHLLVDRHGAAQVAFLVALQAELEHGAGFLRRGRLVRLRRFLQLIEAAEIKLVHVAPNRSLLGPAPRRTAGGVERQKPCPDKRGRPPGRPG